MDAAGRRGEKSDRLYLDFDRKLWQTEQYQLHSDSFLMSPEYYLRWQTLLGPQRHSFSPQSIESLILYFSLVELGIGLNNHELF